MTIDWIYTTNYTAGISEIADSSNKRFKMKPIASLASSIFRKSLYISLSVSTVFLRLKCFQTVTILGF